MSAIPKESAISLQCKEFYNFAKFAVWCSPMMAKYEVQNSENLKKYEDKILKILSEPRGSDLSREGQTRLLEGRLLTLVDLDEANPIVEAFARPEFISNIYQFLYNKKVLFQISQRNFTLMNKDIFASCQQFVTAQLSEARRWGEKNSLSVSQMKGYHLFYDCSLEGILKSHPLLQTFELDASWKLNANDDDLRKDLDRLTLHLKQYCPKLCEIQLRHWKGISDEGYKDLAKRFPDLSSLVLASETPLPSPAVAKCFAKLTHLEHLGLISPEIEKQFIALLQASPLLSSLSISSPTTNRMFAAFENVESLKLHYHPKKMNSTFLLPLADFGKLNRLDMLASDSGYRSATDVQLKEITFKNLTHLLLKNQRLVQTDGLKAFIERHPKLASLDLTGTEIAEQDMKELKEKYPEINIASPQSYKNWT